MAWYLVKYRDNRAAHFFYDTVMINAKERKIWNSIKHLTIKIKYSYVRLE